MRGKTRESNCVMCGFLKSVIRVFFSDFLNSNINVCNIPQLEDEPFNPDYVQVDRILDVAVTEDPDTKEVDTHYLVKWRSLPYEDSTWELEQDVDDDSIAFFKKMLDPPPHSERKVRTLSKYRGV